VIERNESSNYARAKVLDLEEDDDGQRASTLTDADVLIGAGKLDEFSFLTKLCFSPLSY